MKYKKIIMLTIILAFLLAISAVSAAENATDDIVGADSINNKFDSEQNFNSGGLLFSCDNVSKLSDEGYDDYWDDYGEYDDYEDYWDDYDDDEFDQEVIKEPTHIKCDSYKGLIGAKDSISVHILDESNSNKNIGGTAKLTINGKTYKTNVKNGIATFKRIKLPLKAKTYKCKVTFSGDDNYKSSSKSFTIKLRKTADVVILKKNKSMKIGKYVIKLTSGQYKSLVKAFNKDKTKSIKVKTKYKYKVKEPYTKTVKKYKTTKVCKTLYAGVYLPAMKKMKSNGWKKVSEYTYTKKNPRNKQGVGLSAYTYAVTKWVKTSYKTAYKTKYYPITAKIIFEKGDALPGIKLSSHGTFLDYRYIAIA